MASVSPEQIRPGATFLNRMLYSGALAYCVLQTMPEGTPESVVLGLTDSQWQWCVDNEERLWRSLIERQLLYSSDPAVADRRIAVVELGRQQIAWSGLTRIFAGKRLHDAQSDKAGGLSRNRGAEERLSRCSTPAAASLPTTKTWRKPCSVP